MTQDQILNEFIRLIIDILEESKIPYAVGGSVGLWAWGEYRMTGDLDLIVDISFGSMKRLSDELAKHDMLVPVDIMQDLILEDRIDLAINAIHPHTGFKAELFPLREGDDLRKSALERKRLADYGEVIGEVYVHAPEDLIIYKLKYYAISRQTKHARDIASILASDTVLDRDYLEAWIDKKDLRAVWEEVRKG